MSNLGYGRLNMCKYRYLSVYCQGCSWAGPGYCIPHEPFKKIEYKKIKPGYGSGGKLTNKEIAHRV